MTKEEMNYHVDKAIKDFPEWPDHAVCIWVGKRGNDNPSFYALDEVAINSNSSEENFETEGNGVTLQGKSFYYSVYHKYWVRVSPKWYNQRKEELPMLDNNDWYGRGEKPPVGTIVLADYDTFRGEWYIVYIIGYDGDKIVGRWLEGEAKGELFDNYTHISFKPIQTERQRLVNLAITTAEKAGAECDQTFAEALYDAGLLRDKSQ